MITKPQDERQGTNVVLNTRREKHALHLTCDEWQQLRTSYWYEMTNDNDYHRRHFYEMTTGSN